MTDTYSWKKILLIDKWVRMPLNIWKSFALNRRRSINLQYFVEKRSAVQAIETSFKIILLFLFFPPYSPFLNPIENLFNQWKNLIKRSEPQNEDQLYEAVENSSEKITPENPWKNIYLDVLIKRQLIISLIFKI
jgi:transposase